MTPVCQISGPCKFGRVGILLPRKYRLFVECKIPDCTQTLGALETLPNTNSGDARGKIFVLSIFGWRWNTHLSDSALPDCVLLFPVKFWKGLRNSAFFFFLGLCPASGTLVSYFTWASSSSQHTAHWVSRTETAACKGGWVWVGGKGSSGTSWQVNDNI